MEKQDFDHIASSYDDTFTNTEIGKLQRAQVYHFLDKYLAPFKEKSILEINAGTGADAYYLSQKGAEVLATDISGGMIDYAKSQYKESDLLAFGVADIKELKHKFTGRTFDVLFSNFGGLNCLSPQEMNTLFEDSKSLLKKNGKLILVIMGDHCSWETKYFLAKLKPKKAYRRRSKKAVMAHVDGKDVATWYYSPNTILQLATGYKKEGLHPVGYHIPPSYLESFFSKRPKYLSRLYKKEKRIENKEQYASKSDHYLISLVMD